MVVRRIRMDLDTWDGLTRDQQEKAVGRRLGDGAPLSGTREKDRPDLLAVDDAGRRVIPLAAHVRRAHPGLNAGRRIFRKGANYTVPVATGGATSVESGLVFLSYQADVAEQFVPIQQTLDASDALNRWTTAIGSAAFAVLPGFTAGTWLGHQVLD